MHIPFVRMAIFQFLAHLLVDHLAHPVVSSLYYYYSLVIIFLANYYCLIGILEIISLYEGLIISLYKPLNSLQTNAFYKIEIVT